MPFLVSIEHSQSLVYDNPAPAEYLTKVLNKQDAKVFSWEVMLFSIDSLALVALRYYRRGEMYDDQDNLGMEDNFERTE
jgi:hypothetical protein